MKTFSRTSSVFGACLLLLAAGPVFLTTSAVHAADPPTPIVWDGGDGNWNDANWQIGQTPTSVLGRDNGWRETDGVVLNPEITIAGDGVPGNTDVLYDAELFGDFSLRSDQGDVDQRGELLISNAATLELRSSVTTDGKWTQIDATGITVTGAGSKLSRTHTNSSLNGGAFVWGSWQNDPGEVININVLDSAELYNEGQIWFGTYNDSEEDLEVTLKIGENASVIAQGAMRGGINLGNDAGPLEGDINLIYNWDPDANGGLGALDDATYIIDICGLNGMLTLGEFGVVKHEQIMDPLVFGQVWTQTPMSFEDLWDAGILINSHSSDPIFANNFSVIGQPGDSFYKITNIAGIPEPSTLALAALGLLGTGWCRRMRA